MFGCEHKKQTIRESKREDASTVLKCSHRDAVTRHAVLANLDGLVESKSVDHTTESVGEH